MGMPILIIGESGSGKSTSLRNFKPGEVGIINVADKPLPFRSEIKPYNLRKSAKAKNENRYALVKNLLKKSTVKSMVIDDSQYLMAFDSFDKANQVGYGKFTNMAVDFIDLVTFCIDELPDDKLVYFLNHCETTEQGRLKAKTLGKMIDNQITLEGLFSIVIYCVNEKDKHSFITQSDGTTTAKTPMGMFESLTIDNDLKFVDEQIRKYYNLGGTNQ